MIMMTKFRKVSKKAEKNQIKSPDNYWLFFFSFLGLLCTNGIHKYSGKTKETLQMKQQQQQGSNWNYKMQKNGSRINCQRRRKKIYFFFIPRKSWNNEKHRGIWFCHIRHYTTHGDEQIHCCCRCWRIIFFVTQMNQNIWKLVFFCCLNWLI